MTQEQDTILGKVVKLSLEAQCVPGLAGKTKTFCAHVSALKSDTRARALIGNKLPATRSKRNTVKLEAKVRQACVELDARDSRAAELGARATELEKQIEQSASPMRVAGSKY